MYHHGRTVDCFAHPAEALAGLEAWRLEGLEALEAWRLGGLEAWGVLEYLFFFSCVYFEEVRSVNCLFLFQQKMHRRITTSEFSTVHGWKLLCYVSAEYALMKCEV